MRFTPAPRNDFHEFITEYYSRCRSAYPAIVAIAGKWTFEDLIPGLSDFDTRFILRDPMTAEDWCNMSLAIGKVHTQLAKDFPHWARNLEHLPGLNLTESEMLHPMNYFPEFQQWTFYQGDTATIQRIRTTLAMKNWSRKDELFHLRKIATFIGPYQRGIDPAVNVGAWENKYPLHSRFMHYFTPPVQSAVSLASRGHFSGKLLALRAAAKLFRHTEVISELLDAVKRHYEIPELYSDNALSNLEERLDDTLLVIWRQLQEYVSLVKIAPDDEAEDIRQKVKSVAIEPVDLFFESIKFCRLMRGRLLFYSEDIPWFDSSWLVRNELGRMRANFFDKPLTAYGLARFNSEATPDEVLQRIENDVISPAEAVAMQRFSHCLSQPISSGHEKQKAREIADLFEPVLNVLEKLNASMMQFAASRGETR